MLDAPVSYQPPRSLPRGWCGWCNAPGVFSFVLIREAASLFRAPAKYKMWTY